ncbi:hypothetical protein EZV62_028060 [Acer yangbiense]|uniref:Protein EARLY FLOWERING 3 n=1 Tax=Acer yangbiense TaxID=1000413 RepID=A0A5C7GQ46_9ROSI|nr:hypothetical protein EZV62_028060 [Acer yangbiense]
MPRQQSIIFNTMNQESRNSSMGLSPDDVVGVIGEKQFWKARGAIIDQQRVFAVQVFELHKLMKVQKLIARSPHLLLDDQLYMNKPHLDMSLVKKLPPKSILEASPQIIVKLKDNYQKRNAKMRMQLWLVSVMSPSEGLVYKPYSGPCPPTAGFVAPFYGSCGPVSLTLAGGDFLSTACGVPASHQQGIGILPGNPPLASSPAAERPKGDALSLFPMEPIVQASDQNAQTNEQQSQVIKVVPHNPRLATESAARIFQSIQEVQASDQNAQTNEQQSRVIKVVPHNPSLATELAARIFQSIQEGRKQYD